MSALETVMPKTSTALARVLARLLWAVTWLVLVLALPVIVCELALTRALEWRRGQS